MNRTTRDRSRTVKAKEATRARKAARKGRCALKFMYLSAPGNLAGEAR